MSKRGKMTRRDFVKGLAATGGGLLLASCAPKVVKETVIVEKPVEKVITATPMIKKPVTLSFWQPGSEVITEEVLRDLMHKFEAAHKDIKIELTVLPSDGFSEKMTTVIGASVGAPDVSFFWDDNWLPECLDLRPYIEADGFDTGMYLEGAWDAWAPWRDRIVGLPFGVGANFIMYHKGLYDEVGVPYPEWDLTTEQYLELIPKLTDKTKMRWGGDRPRGPYRAIWFNYGARPFSEDGTTVDGYLNSPKSVAAYTWLWDLVATDATPTSAEIETLSVAGSGPVDLWMAGRIANATLNDEHMLRAFKEGVDFGVIPEPMVPGNERWVHSWSLRASVWSKTKEPEAAWTFLKYWAGPEGQRSLFEQERLSPSIKTLIEEFEGSLKPQTQAFFKVAEFSNSYAWINKHPYFWNVIGAITDIWDRIQLHLIERDEIEAALNALVPDAQKALDEARERLG